MPRARRDSAPRQIAPRRVYGRARVDIGPGGEQQLDDRARPGEMEWGLPVPATLVNARGILGDHPSEQIGSIEMRGRTSIGDGARCNQFVGGGTGRGVKGVKSASPPIAAPVGVSAEGEKNIDHRWIASEGHDRWRIEGE